MKIELTLTEMMVLIDLIKDGATLNEIKQAVDKEPNQTIDEVKIGKQVWSKKDLKVTHFRNGDPIPLVKNEKEWTKLTTAAYCISPSGGYLYNWYAVNDPRGLAPEGWHIPTDEEWTALTMELDGKSIAAINMKSSDTDTLGWNVNTDIWWSASPDGASYAWFRGLTSDYDGVYRSNYYRWVGFSVRCLRD